MCQEIEMPQPLSRVKPNIQIHVSAAATQMVPQFNQAIIKVIAHWSHIDGNWASIFSSLLKSDIAVGTAVYQAFNGLELRKLALMAAAEKSLPEWQQIAIKTVWKAISQSRDQRNRFCHHVWGYSPELRDALLLMDPSVVVDVNVSYRQRVANRRDGGGVILPEAYDRSKIFVYRQPDFDRAVKDASKAGWLVTLLYYAVGVRANEKGRSQLVREPLFQQAVESFLRGKSPELASQLRPTEGSDPPLGTWDHLERFSISLDHIRKS